MDKLEKLKLDLLQLKVSIRMRTASNDELQILHDCLILEKLRREEFEQKRKEILDL